MKTKNELRGHLRTKMVKLDTGRWENPYSKQRLFMNCSHALDATVKYFMGIRNGEKRRVTELGEEWREISLS